MPKCVTKNNEAKRIAYYDMGYSDSVIAKLCGMSKIGIFYWRKRTGRTANRCFGGDHTSIPLSQIKLFFDRHDCSRLYDEFINEFANEID